MHPEKCPTAFFIGEMVQGSATPGSVNRCIHITWPWADANKSSSHHVVSMNFGPQPEVARLIDPTQLRSVTSSANTLVVAAQKYF